MKKLFYNTIFFYGLVVMISNYLFNFLLKYFGLSKFLTYGAFSYPITFLITDLANRAIWKNCSSKNCFNRFFYGILLTLLISTNFEDLISIRIAIGSAIAFIIAQNVDVGIFDKLRKKIWYVAPLISSVFGSIVDTFFFFSIAFLCNRYTLDYPLALGDLSVKLFVALSMLIPFRLLLLKITDFSGLNVSKKLM